MRTMTRVSAATIRPFQSDVVSPRVAGDVVVGGGGVGWAAGGAPAAGTVKVVVSDIAWVERVRI
jgi:hypothetical protein